MTNSHFEPWWPKDEGFDYFMEVICRLEEIFGDQLDLNEVMALAMILYAESWKFGDGFTIESDGDPVMGIIDVVTIASALGKSHYEPDWLKQKFVVFGDMKPTYDRLRKRFALHAEPL